jgi:isopenicillin N synthase-like dioxygenase
VSRFHVPTIDLAGDRATVATQVDRACRDVGFFEICGHGVPPEVLDGLAAAMDRFFDLDLEAKLQWVRPAAENRGYSPPKSESLSLSAGLEQASRMNDFFEAFNVGAGVLDYGGDVPEAMSLHYAPTTWPDTPGFRSAVERYWPHARRVAATLTGIFEDALSVERGFFDAIAGHPINVLRMNNYALPPGTEVDIDGDLVGMGEHTDFGIVTILWADQAPGLQVLSGEGRWHDVSPTQGNLLVNLGDLTTRLTNEQWLSTLHRVKPPLVDGTIRRRRSAAFFHDGDAEAVVGPLPGFVDADRPPVYAPVTVDEHVRAKLAGSRAGVLNPAAERERDRVRSGS